MTGVQTCLFWGELSVAKFKIFTKFFEFNRKRQIFSFQFINSVQNVLSQISFFIRVRRSLSLRHQERSQASVASPVSMSSSVVTPSEARTVSRWGLKSVSCDWRVQSPMHVVTQSVWASTGVSLPSVLYVLSHDGGQRDREYPGRLREMTFLFN